MRQRIASLFFLATAIFALAFASPAQARETLKQGDQGTDVKNLNNQLVKLTYLPKSYKDSGSYSAGTAGGVMAYQKTRGLSRDSVAGPATRKALKKSADANSRPQPKVKSTAKKWIEGDLSRQVMRLVVDGKVKRTISMSSGRPGYLTPKGDYSILRKLIVDYSIPFENAKMPLTSYFYRGYASHESNDVPGGGNGFGASHGCLRIPGNGESKEVYAFATVGTKVYIR